MKNVFIWVGVALILGGCILGYFTGIEQAAWIELAGFASGLAICVASIIKKSEKKDWKLYVSIVGVVVGTILMIWGGIAKDLITSIIAAVFGLVILVTSILVPTIANKSKKD